MPEEEHRILIITGREFEDIELLYPYYRLREAGYSVVVAGPSQETLVGKHGYSVKPDTIFHDVIVDQYAGLVIPGGRAPERIRLDEDALRIVRGFFEAEKPVAVICHGPQLLISAGLVRGRRLTSWPGIKDDVIAAGGIWLDEPVVVDGLLVSSRMPSDIPYWMRSYLSILEGKA